MRDADGAGSLPVNLARGTPVSSPPMVTSAVMFNFFSAASTFCMLVSDLVGLVRAVPKMEPPRR